MRKQIHRDERGGGNEGECRAERYWSKKRKGGRNLTCLSDFKKEKRWLWWSETAWNLGKPRKKSDAKGCPLTTGKASKGDRYGAKK